MDPYQKTYRQNVKTASIFCRLNFVVWISFILFTSFSMFTHFQNGSHKTNRRKVMNTSKELQHIYLGVIKMTEAFA